MACIVRDIQVPTGLSGGPYYVGWIVDSREANSESWEDNNVAAVFKMLVVEQ